MIIKLLTLSKNDNIILWKLKHVHIERSDVRGNYYNTNDILYKYKNSLNYQIIIIKSFK